MTNQPEKLQGWLPSITTDYPEMPQLLVDLAERMDCTVVGEWTLEDIPTLFDADNNPLPNTGGVMAHCMAIRH